MRTALVVMASVAAVACSSGVAPADRLAAVSASSAGDATAPSAEPAAEVILAATWDVAPGQRRGREVEVRWTTSKCALFRRADVIESTKAVTITVQEQLVGDGLCPTSRVASHTVTLKAPLGTRTLLDGSASPGRPVI